jgi:hypothetical protein
MLRARALEQALRMLIDAAVQTACKIAEDGDRRWHVVDLVCATNDAEKLLAVDPPPSGASPQAETSASEVAYEHMLAQRGLDRETDTICVKCYGSGVRAYGNTATWRGGIGGSTITMDVCDRCWGSGNDTKRWPSHRLSPAPVSPVEPTTCPKCRSNTRAYRLAVADVIDGRMAGMTSCRDEWHSRMPMVSPVEPEPLQRPKLASCQRCSNTVVVGSRCNNCDEPTVEPEPPTKEQA